MGMDNNLKKVIGRNLKSLRERNQYTYEHIAEKTGIYEGSLRQYESGTTGLSVEKLAILADFYCVTVDYILGRQDLFDAGYMYRMDKLKELSYERYLIERKTKKLDKEVETFWPYNCIEGIFGEPLDENFDKFELPITEDQYEGLKTVIKTLTDREQDVLNGRFQYYKTLEELAQAHSVTKCRIQQILAKALRKLRNPARANIIIKGLTYYKKREADSKLAAETFEAEMEQRRKLDISRAEWNVKSQYILRELFNNKEKTVDLLRDMLEALEPDSDKKITDVIDVECADVLDLPFDNLELSVRSYNCIARYFNGRMRLKDITVRMVRDLAQSGQLPSVRNLGAKSVEEIFGALKRIGVPVTVVNAVSE